MVPYEFSGRPAAFFRTDGPSISVIETIPEHTRAEGAYLINPKKLAKFKFQIKLQVSDPDSVMNEIAVTGTSSDTAFVQNKNIEALGSPSNNGIQLIEVEVEDDIEEGEATLTLTATDVGCLQLGLRLLFVSRQRSILTSWRSPQQPCIGKDPPTQVS